MHVGAFIESFTRRAPESDPAFRAEINETARCGLLLIGAVEVGFAMLTAAHVVGGGWWLALALSALGAIALGVSRSTGRARAIALSVAVAALSAAEKLRSSEMRTCYAENASSTLGLAAALSHDLNSPVGALRSSVDMLIRHLRRRATDAQHLTGMTEPGAVIDAALTRN